MMIRMLFVCAVLFSGLSLMNAQEMVMVDHDVQPRQQSYPVDSSFIKGTPKIEFEEQFHDFGNIQKGDRPKHTFEFFNRGTAPMRLDFVSACECTELKWSKTLIYPGQKGHILAKYDSSEKEGEQEVSIDIIAYKMLPGQEEPKEDEIILSQARFRVFVQLP